MYAILPAAGSGSRMGELVSEKPKVLLPMPDGRSVLEHSISNIIAADVVKGVVVAAPEAFLEEFEGVLSRLKIESQLVLGGASRQESIENALQCLEGKAEYVLIHDAARPCCSPSLIEEVAKAARESGAAILGIPCSSTLKRVSSEREIEATVPREQLWFSQTPQVFSYSLIQRAYQNARQDRFSATDDSHLIERIGHPVKIIRGSQRNIKLTEPDDLQVITDLFK